jgi:TonB family protein
VLLGGGYLAYKNFAPQNGAQTAYNDSYTTDQYGDDPLRAGPVETGNNADDLDANEATATPASETSAAPPARRRSTAAVPTEEVPEATIGVTPTNVTTDGYAASESPDLVVTAARRPVWDRTPSARRLSAMYPERALERGREGEARLHCTVLDGGALDCAKTSETSGGFGNAALRVARTLRHAPQFADGSNAAGSPVNLRVVFRIDDNARRG